MLDALDHLYQPVEPAAFPNHLFGILAGLLPGTIQSFDSMVLATRQVESHVTAAVAAVLPVARLEEAVRAYLHQNPLLDLLVGQPSGVFQIDGVISQRELRRTDFYQHCWRPLELRHQVAAGVNWTGHVCGFTVNRGGSRPFSDREVEMVTRLRPHVGRAFAGTLRWEKLQRQWGSVSAVTAAVDEAGTGAKIEESALTERQEEVLHWMSAGKRDVEIAEILDISPRTVHKHVEHVLARLRVESRTAAAALARVQ